MKRIIQGVSYDTATEIASGDHGSYPRGLFVGLDLMVIPFGICGVALASIVLGLLDGAGAGLVTMLTSGVQSPGQGAT